MKMTNEPNKLNERFKFFENLMDFKERDFKLLFWFCSLLTIPVFAYLYSLPLALLLWAISEIFYLNIEHSDTLIKFGVIICFFFAFWTQLYLWKMYKNRRAAKDKPIN